MATVARVQAQDTGDDLTTLLNAQATANGLPSELLLALAIAESDVSVRAERWGRHSATARAALAAEDLERLQSVVALVELETPGDISFGLFQQTVRWADEGDHSSALDNILALRELYFDAVHATRVAARKLGRLFQQFGDPLESLCRYNEPALPGPQTPNRARYRASLEQARTHLEEGVMDFPIEVKLTPNMTPSRPKTLGVVIHSTRSGQTSFDLEQEYTATVNWFLNTSIDLERRVSAHFVVGGSKACRMVSDDNMAWHAGEHNATHLGIEIAQPLRTSKYSDFEYRAAAAIVRQWCDKYGIPIKHVTKETQRGLIGHEETTQGKRVGKDDPGTRFDWERFLALVRDQASVPSDEQVQARLAEVISALGFVTLDLANRLQHQTERAEIAEADAERDAAHAEIQQAIDSLRGQALNADEVPLLKAHDPDLVNAIGFVTGDVARALQDALDGARSASKPASRQEAYQALKAAVSTLRSQHP